MKAALKTVAYHAAKAFLSLLLVPYFRLSVKGREKVPPRGTVIFAANHFSYGDPLLLGIAMPRRVWFVMSATMYRKPWFYPFSRLMDVVPADVGERFQPSSIKKVLRVMQAGGAVGIFPEGQRSRTGRLLEPLRGVGVFAQRGGAPVFPVAIVGTREAWPAGQWVPRPWKVRILIGDPIPQDAEPTPDALAERARDAIAALLVEHGKGDYVEGTP